MSRARCPGCGHALGSGMTVHVAANVCGRVSPDVCPPLPFDARAVSERDWRRLVMATADAAGWLVVHVRSVQDRSGKWVNPVSLRGWPDLVVMREGIMVAMELKAEGGRVRPDQRRVLDVMRTIPGVHGVFAKPSHWPRVVTVLR